MKSNYLRTALLLSFLIITFPSPHVILPNAIILPVFILQTIEYSNEIKININLEAVMALIVLGSLILIILQPKLFNLGGIII